MRYHYIYTWQWCPERKVNPFCLLGKGRHFKVGGILLKIDHFVDNFWHLGPHQIEPEQKINKWDSDLCPFILHIPGVFLLNDKTPNNFLNHWVNYSTLSLQWYTNNTNYEHIFFNSYEKDQAISEMSLESPR